MRQLFLSLFLAASLSGLYAAEPTHPSPDPTDMWTGRGQMLVPDGAKLTLETDRTDYLLGENVAIQFVLENTGKEPFKADFGGDYRGADRSLRFKVTATDEQGHVAPSPDPNPMCMGGMGGPITLAPGQKVYFQLFLTRYCQFDQPGRYTIRITHDFGWKEGALKRPVGEITLNFRMPTPEEAAQVVAHMEKLPDNGHGVLWGKKDTEEIADFRCLRYPVYLKILEPLAQSGDARALEAIGNLPSPEATQCLINLANGSDLKQSLAAAHTLSLRLPDPEFKRQLPPRGPFNLYGTTKRQILSQEAWDPSFVEPVRALAKKFLARDDKDSIDAGAFMIQAVGTPEDASLIFPPLDKALNNTMSTPRRDPKADVLDYPAPILELVRAIKILQERGYNNSHPSGNSQILGYFVSFAEKPGPRPDDWLQNLDAFGASNCYPIRQAALESIPTPMPDNCVKFVQRGLADEDYGVCRIASDIAGKSGHKEFLKPLLQIIETENEEWLLRSAGDSANQLGGGYEFLDAWADRLVDEDLYAIALDNLQVVLTGLSGGTSGRTDLTREERLALKSAWKDFLHKNEVALRQSKKFKYTDPAVTPALFGRARQWDVPDGKQWPPSQPDK